MQESFEVLFFIISEKVFFLVLKKAIINRIKNSEFY
jgi:hypothetical protein